MSRHILRLFQGCLDLGYHPASWKKGQTTPVPKANGKARNLLTAYRPITLLLVLSKTLEQVMANRFTDYGLAGALPAEHFGCLPAHSREQAVLTLSERVRESWRRIGGILARQGRYKGRFRPCFYPLWPGRPTMLAHYRPLDNSHTQQERRQRHARLVFC